LSQLADLAMFLLIPHLEESMANPNEQKDPSNSHSTSQSGMHEPADRSVDASRQGVSNRPGDEEPGSGVDAAPGNDGAKKQPGQGGTGHGAMSPNAHRGQGEKNAGGEDGGGKNN
jgi:hypothetical protein